MDRSRTRILTVLVVVVSVCALTALWIRVFGRVRGEEFSPDTFSYRFYVYYRIPVVHIQVWPVVRTGFQGKLAKHLTANGYVRKISPPKQWHFVKCYASGRLLHTGDAQILMYYLEARNRSFDLHWLKWTDDHPKLAKILWPEVAAVARDNLYVLVPDLFALAAAADSPRTLRRELDRVLARKYETIAGIQEKLGKDRIAEVYYSKALEYEPTRAASLRGRQRCLRRLGRTEQSSS